MRPLELTENEQQFLAEVMRTLELKHPEATYEVRPSLADGTPGAEALEIAATRIIEGAPQEPTVRNSISRSDVANGDPEQLAQAMANTIFSRWQGVSGAQATGPASSPFPYGEWPAHNARIGDVDLTWGVLVVRHVERDTLVLIGSCATGDHQGTRDCAAEAGGYRWLFRGVVFDEQAQEAGRVRLRIRSDGDFTAERMETK